MAYALIDKDIVNLAQILMVKAIDLEHLGGENLCSTFYKRGYEKYKSSERSWYRFHLLALKRLLWWTSGQCQCAATSEGGGFIAVCRAVV